MGRKAMMRNIPKGYKQTEVGIIPSDWEVKKLGEIVDFLDGKRKPIKDSDRAKMHGQYPYYGASGVIDYVNDYLFDDNLILLGEDGENILSRNCRLAFQISGKVWVNNHAHVLKPKPKNNITFITELLESINYEQYNTGTAQPKLNQKVCSGIIIPVPPTKAEQTAIAAALIISLEKLIAKKRNIKQGAMQELLTGKIRLPGFSGEWEVKRLSEIAPLQRGFDLPTTQLQAGNYPVVYSNGIDNFHSEYKAEAPGVVTGRSGTLGKVTYVDENYWPHNTSLWVTDFNENYPLFIYYLYLHIKLERFGTGSGVPTLNRNDVHDFKVAIPNHIEQTAIAQILSDMDAEIEVLEQKLAKYRMIKQGMMQELLTGKTRLV